MPQEMFHAQHHDNAQEESTEQGQLSQEHAEQESIDALDDVLDDIQSVLATNAQDYVSSFVQKGGE